MSDYPKVSYVNGAWIAEPNSRSKIPGVFLTKLAAIKALKQYETIREEVAKQKASKKEKVKENV